MEDNKYSNLFLNDLPVATYDMLMLLCSFTILCRIIFSCWGESWYCDLFIYL